MELLKPFDKISTNFATDKNQPARSIQTIKDGVLIYKNILECWKSNKEYRQASSGITHLVRNVLVLDIDDVLTINEEKKLVSNLKPTYVVLNPSTNHLQFGFLYNKDLWHYTNKGVHRKNILYINHKASEILGKPVGDNQYTGWQCKNPFNNSLQLVYFNEKNTIDPILFTPSSFSLYNNTNSTARKQYTKQSQKIAKKNATIEESRDAYVYTFLRQAIWSYMREHNDYCPSEEWIYEKAQDLNEEAAEYTKKHELLTEAEIRAIVKCTGSWSIKHYKDGWKDLGKDIKNTELARKCSLIIRKAEKLLKWLRIQNTMRNNQKSIRDIAKETGISKSTVQALLKEDFDFDAKINFDALYSKDSLSKELYNDLYNDLNAQYKEYFKYNTLFSFSLYNNTNSTVESVDSTSIAETPQEINDEKLFKENEKRNMKFEASIAENNDSSLTILRNRLWQQLNEEKQEKLQKLYA